MTRIPGILIGLGTAVAIAGAAVADCGPTTPNPTAEIRATIDAFQAAVTRGESAAVAAELLFAPDVVMVGEGEAGTRRGIKIAIAEMEAHWAAMGPGGIQKCSKLQLADDTAVYSADTYASFLALHCEPNPPAVEAAQDVRVLYVWKKLPQGWRVALEQWGIGKL
jgi:ketosteroid isomerase-like protein